MTVMSSGSERRNGFCWSNESKTCYRCAWIYHTEIVSGSN